MISQFKNKIQFFCIVAVVGYLVIGQFYSNARIPEEISNAEAAPLMCAGSAVFSPLHKFKVAPTDRVGVIGVGGLGHLAIQFAAKMGCQVVVSSGTQSKRAEALALGATEFYAFTDYPPEIEPLDHLLLHL